MKKTIITVVAILALSVSLSWGCQDSNCHDNSPADIKVVPGGTVPTPPSQTIQQNKETLRSGTASDFVTPFRAPEKDCGSGDGVCHNAGKPQENLRAPERKCETPSCG